MNNLPDANQRNVYYWYYATQVMHNLVDANWDRWNRQVRRVLIETQCRDGAARPAVGTPSIPAKTPGAARADACS